MPGDVTVIAAPGACDRAKATLKAALQDLIVTIHEELENAGKRRGAW